MHKLFYKWTFWLLVAVLVFEVVGKYYPIFNITLVYTYIAFMVSLVAFIFIVVPFILEFLTFRVTLFNQVLMSILAVAFVIWIFNDFVPGFFITTPQLYKVLVYSIFYGALLPILYKLARKL